MNIAVIPARGGSKRIPGKNIRDFLGRPIIAYSIEAAVESGLFDEVMVSTDSEEIAGVAKEYGASIPFMRSEKASDDYAATRDVLFEVLHDYISQGKSFEWLCCIYPTAPFVTSEKLCNAYEMMQQKNADALVPVVAYSHPPQRGLIIVDSFVKAKWPEKRKGRSQDLETIYQDSGQFYFVRVDVFMREKKLSGTRRIPMILSELEVQDIDNETDWKLAEVKYQLMVKQGRT